MAFQRGTRIQPQLGAVDFSPMQRGAEAASRSIMQGTARAAEMRANTGAITGQMFANLGQQIGQAVQQIGLKQEQKKQKEAEDAMLANIGKTLMGNQQMGGPNQAGMNANMTPIQRLGRQLYTDKQFRSDVQKSDIGLEQLTAFAQLAQQQQKPAGPSLSEVMGQLGGAGAGAAPSGVGASTSETSYDFKVNPETGEVEAVDVSVDPTEPKDDPEGEIVSGEELTRLINENPGLRIEADSIGDGKFRIGNVRSASGPIAEQTTTIESPDQLSPEEKKARRVRNLYGEGFVLPGGGADEGILAVNPTEGTMIVEDDESPVGYRRESIPGEPATRAKPKFPEVLDQETAKELSDWQTGGKFRAQENLRTYNSVIAGLASGSVRTGQLVDFVPESFGMSDYVRSISDPESQAAVRAIEYVVFQSLRETLGAQFTEREGRRLVAATYDPRLPPKENIERLESVSRTLEETIASKNSMSDYALQNNTMRGYRGSVPYQVFIENLRAIEAEAGQPEGEDKSSFSSRTSGGFTITEVE